MEVIPKMIDLAIKPTEIENVKVMAQAVGTVSAEPYYPYGLAICLDAQTLEKLDMEGEIECGDTVHFHAMAKCTSVSDNQQAGKRVELQIMMMSAENEDEENEADDEAEERAELPIAHKAKNPYKK